MTSIQSDNRQMADITTHFKKGYGSGIRFIRIFLFITLLLIQGCGHGNIFGKIQGTPVDTPPRESIAITPDPAMRTGEFENGFRYILYKNNEPRDRISLHLDIQVGSMYENDHEQGLAHFLEHLVYDGSTHFEPGELVKYFQSIGMQFGADANAHTGFYETVYDMLLPEGTKEQIENALVVMQDFAEGAHLQETEIEREGKIVLAEKRTRDSVSYRTFVKTLNFSLPGTKLVKRLPIGDENIIKNADQKLLKDFYDSWYRPEKMVLVMAGDFDPDMALPLIRDKFASMKPRAPARDEPELGKISHDGMKSFYHYEAEAGSTTVTIERVNIIPQAKESYSLEKKLLTERIAGMILQNRLNKITGKPETPFTEASTGSGIYYKSIEYAEIAATSSPENWERTLSTIEQTLRTALIYGFTASELERVKNDFLASLENTVKAKTTRNSEDIARQIIMDINEDRTFQSPEQEKQLYSEMLAAMTLEEVHQAFKILWKEDNRLILVTGNAQIEHAEKKAENIILSAYQHSMSLPVVMPETNGKPVFPYSSKPESQGEIIERQDIEDLGITIVEFKNGVRLQLKKTNFKADEVVFSLIFGNGRSDEPESTPGLSLIAAEVINESGLGQMEKERLEEALSGKSTQIAFSVADGYFIFSGQTISEETDLLFQLLNAYITDPGFREESFHLAMERFGQQYLSLSRTVDGVMPLKGEAFFTGGDTRFGLPAYDAFKKITLDDVKNWLAPSFNKDCLEISIAGDIDIDRIIETAGTYLGSLPARTEPSRQRPLSPLSFPSGKTLEEYLKTDIPKGLVVVSWLTDEFWYIERTRRLSALGAAFSERLRKTIREKLGAAYSPFAYNNSSQAYPFFGLFQAIVPVQPDQAEMVADEIKNISSDIRLNGILEEELRLAVDPILTHIKDMRRTNTYWLNSVLKNSWRYPQQLDWSRTIQNDYSSITSRDLTNLAKQYLINEKAAVIIVKPQLSKGDQSN
ncbi:MAG: insulinase family protein [Proteobacteria bacterium]|nr:insulinase family protein [Pseudomonadota bacterium]